MRVLSENAVCPNCKLAGQLRKRGFWNTKKRGHSRRFYCARCEHEFPIPLDPTIQQVLPLRSLRESDWKAVAMYAIGLPLESIETLAGIKRETFRKKLTCVFSADLWDAMEETVYELFPQVPDSGMGDLMNEFVEYEAGKPAFRRAGLLRARKWGALTTDQQEALIDMAEEFQLKSIQIPRFATK